jgi:hypothetical protein
MPEENIQDANMTVSSSDPDGLLSSPDGSAAPIPTGDQNGDDAGKKDGDAPASGANDDGKGKAASGAEDEIRYDQLPRFQELNAKVKEEREARIAAEAKLALLEKSPLNPDWLPAANDQMDFKDTSKMTAEELREWQEDDPVGYAANLRKEAAWEARQAIKAESLRNDTVSRIEQTFNQYAKENPTFNEMWESGEIERFMNEHPGHNAISAHMVMTAGKQSGDMKAMIDKAVAEAVAKATKETEERVRKDFLAKRGATVISSTSAARSADDGVDTALKNTNQFGGTTTVLASRLAEMRRRAAGL